MSSKQKLALFLYERPSLWTSCEKINQNLIKLYQEYAKTKGNEVQVFFLDGSYYGNQKLVPRVLEFDPDQLVFIDHRLYPDKVLGPLKEAGLSLETKKYIIHIFGHYALRMERFEMIFSLLKGCEVIYRFPSQRFLNSFSKIFPEEFRKSMDICPIPVESKYQYQALGDKKKTKRILFAGRISPKKNCHLLVKSAALLRKTRKDFKLLLAGSFDNYFPDNQSEPGAYMGSMTELVNSIDPNNEYIEFLGFLEESELIKELNQSDVFCSLSTMIADDYGLALAEAMVSGLPIVATDWGGYSQIMGMGQGAIPISVSYENGAHNLPLDLIAKGISEALDYEENDRAQRSQRNCEAFSNKAIEKVFSRERFMAQPLPNKLTRIMESAHNTFVGDRLYETIFKEVWEPLGGKSEV